MGTQPVLNIIYMCMDGVANTLNGTSHRNISKKKKKLTEKTSNGIYHFMAGLF